MNNLTITSGTGSNISVAITPFTQIGPFGVAPKHPIINGVLLTVKMNADNCEIEKSTVQILNCGSHLDDKTREKMYNEDKNKIVATVWIDNYVFYSSIGAKSYNKVKKSNGGWKSAKINEIGLQFGENAFYHKECVQQVNLPEEYMPEKNSDEVRFEDKENGLSYPHKKAPKSIVTCSFFVKPTKEKLLTITLD